MYKLIFARILNPISDTRCDYFENGYLFLKKVKNDWVVKKIGARSEMSFNIPSGTQILHWPKKTIMPAFFDMHFHWVQDDVRLMPKDSLLEWLSQYTWPYENKFKSKQYSKERAQKFSKELLSVGTVGGACYSSIHSHTVDDALKFFVGDYIVGNVLMTMNSPNYLLQTKKQAVDSVKKLSSKYKSKYAITPRFAPTTHLEVMKQAAIIGKKNGSFIQTHLSETLNEIEFVLSIYEQFGFDKSKTNYTDIYHAAQILSRKTIMGHGIYLSEKELRLLSKTKTKIAHCPTSNAPIKEKGLGSGLFNFKQAEKYKLDWALASDIGGGPFLSMFDVMRSFVEQNKKMRIREATYVKALYRSTMAGAKMLGLDKTHGNLMPGKFANFVVLNDEFRPARKNADAFFRLLMKKNKGNRSFKKVVASTYYKGNLVYHLKSNKTGQ